MTWDSSTKCQLRIVDVGVWFPADSKNATLASRGEAGWPCFLEGFLIRDAMVVHHLSSGKLSIHGWHIGMFNRKFMVSFRVRP